MLRRRRARWGAAARPLVSAPPEGRESSCFSLAREEPCFPASHRIHVRSADLAPFPFAAAPASAPWMRRRAAPNRVQVHHPFNPRLADRWRRSCPHCSVPDRPRLFLYPPPLCPFAPPRDCPQGPCPPPTTPRRPSESALRCPHCLFRHCCAHAAGSRSLGSGINSLLARRPSLPFLNPSPALQRRPFIRRYMVCWPRNGHS